MAAPAELPAAAGASAHAATIAGAAALCIEIDEERIDKRIRDGYCDRKMSNLDEALSVIREFQEKREPVSIGLVGNAAEILPALVERGVTPDVVTDQTSAHDPLNGYYPAGLTKGEADSLRISDPNEYLRRAYTSIGAHVRAMLTFQVRGSVTFDYGNNIRGIARDFDGVSNAFDFPGFVPAFVREQGSV